MIIKFSRPFYDEDGYKRSESSCKEILLWVNHRNYTTHSSHANQSNMLVVARVGGRDGYFLSKEKFRMLVLNGTITIMDSEEN